MKLRRLLACCLCALALLPAALAAQGGAVGYLAAVTIPESLATKFPRVAAGPEGVYVAGNAAQLHAQLYTRPAHADGFAPAERIGPAEGQPDYSTATVAVAPDGRLVYAWINQPQRTIFARVRAPGGQWGPTRTIRAGEPFPVNVAIAASNTELIAAWRNPDRPVVFSRSADGGVTWSAPSPISEKAGINAPALAAGTSGTIAVAYTQESSRQLQVFVGLWNGKSFTTRRVSSSGANFADPGVAVLGDGRVAVGYRGIEESGAASGVFYAEQTADGGWPVARLVAGKVTGPVSVAADEAGGLSVFWIGAAQGRSQVWFARQPGGGAWSAPAGSLAVGDGTIFNAHGAVAEGHDGMLYGHVASEYFVGDRIYARAYRFGAGATSSGATVSASPVIEGDAPGSRAESLSVALHSVRGGPTELRWRWDAPPTATDPWQPFAERLSVPAPAIGIGCGERTLYTQVRSAASLQKAAAHDSITLDRAVQASLSTMGIESAPGYTNDPTALLRVDATADCSGLSEARSLGSATPLPVSEPGFTLAVPVEPVDGAHTLGVALTDTLGNSTTLTATVIYDGTPPTLSVSAPLAVRADPRATVLQTITLEGAGYADTSGAQPWALAVAVAHADAPAAASSEWRLYPLEADSVRVGAEGRLVLSIDLSLADLLPRAQRTPGAYHYQVRAVDQAGNFSAEVAAGSIALEQVSYPWVALPLVSR